MYSVKEVANILVGEGKVTLPYTTFKLGEASAFYRMREEKYIDEILLTKFLLFYFETMLRKKKLLEKPAFSRGLSKNVAQITLHTAF